MKKQQTNTKTHSSIKDKFDQIRLDHEQDQFLSTTDKKEYKTKEEKEKEKLSANKLKTASREATAAKTRSLSSHEATKKLSKADLSHQDEISDEQAARNAGGRTSSPKTKPSTDLVTPQNLPKLMSKALSTNDNKIIPEWHMVKHLPGYLASGIRSIGRAVFKPFTDTKIEDIQVLASLGGQGPNTDKEINAVANYVLHHGRRDTEAELIFHDRIPDYSADIKIFKTLGYTFMLVKDFAGKYVYSWPTSDEKVLSHKKENPRLKENKMKKITLLQFLLSEGIEQKMELLTKQFGTKLLDAADKDGSAKSLLKDHEPAQNVKHIITTLSQADPSGERGAFITFILRMYSLRQFRVEDVERIKDTLSEFIKKKNSLPPEQKDINRFANLDQLYDAVEGTEEHKSNRSVKKETKQTGVEVLIKTDKFLAVRLLTHEAACYYASGTKWCTVNKSNFDHYSKNDPLFVIIIAEKDAQGRQRKFQFHYESGQLMNERDQEITKTEIKLLSSYPEWSKFLEKIIKDKYMSMSQK
jgi:hypothetical protein